MVPHTTPPIGVAAIAIMAVAAMPNYKCLNEPFRAAAYALGWGFADGTDWWDRVMDLIG